MGVFNVRDVPAEFIDDPAATTGLQTLYLGACAGGKRLVVNIDRVNPGAVSCKYHSHSLKDEFFLILRGSGTVRLGDGESPVTQGDFIAKPAGGGLAHQFINTGADLLEILDCSTDEADDIVTYPDERIVYVKRSRMKFSLDDALVDGASRKRTS